MPLDNDAPRTTIATESVNRDSRCEACGGTRRNYHFPARACSWCADETDPPHDDSAQQRNDYERKLT